MRTLALLLGGVLMLSAPVAFAGKSKKDKASEKAAPATKVTMHKITPDGVGDSDGTIAVSEAKDGLELDVDLAGLAPGEHGFHLHEKPSCDPAEKDGKKVAGQSAGAHWDPDGTKAHKGPGGGGHKGDLPKLTVGADGKVKAKLTVAGLKMADVEGKALMVHANGDNYSDVPKPLGGGGDRVVCGVIPGGAPAAAPAPDKGAPTEKTPAAPKPAK